MSLFLLLPLLLEESADLATGSVKRNPGQPSDYSSDSQLSEKVLLSGKNKSLSLQLLPASPSSIPWNPTE